MAKLVQFIVRYIERANSSGEVGRLGKRSTDLFACAEFVDFYVAIENALRARTAEFIERAYSEKV
jgi:hypothetical protein